MATLHLPDALRAEMLVYARESYPDEACGFLIGTGGDGAWTLAAVRAARNLHPSREDRFAIDPNEYAKAEAYCAKHKKKQLRILGFWHSHPQSPPTPSSIDLEWARGLFESFQERYLYLIVSLQDSQEALACWRLDASGARFEPVAFG
ncbi:MAG: M67 family metallopeptidase [Planctomycetota bacterium]|nr:M67 family metallopeptidase [Planctomycetota bacterium]